MEQQAKAPQELRNAVNYLRSSKAGMKIRVGILNGKRIDYFKGTCYDRHPVCAPGVAAVSRIFLLHNARRGRFELHLVNYTSLTASASWFHDHSRTLCLCDNDYRESGDAHKLRTCTGPA